MTCEDCNKLKKELVDLKAELSNRLFELKQCKEYYEKKLALIESILDDDKLPIEESWHYCMHTAIKKIKEVLKK